MKITGASVHDPLEIGNLAAPHLNIMVSEVPHATSEPQLFESATKGRVFRVTRFGPFVDLEYLRSADLAPVKLREGHYNLDSLGGVTPLVPVQTLCPNTDDDRQFYFPLDRARRLLRRYEHLWEFVLDERAAEIHLIHWRLRDLAAVCKHKTPSGICCGEVEQEVYYRGIYIPMCADHRRAFSTNRVEARKASA